MLATVILVTVTVVASWVITGTPSGPASAAESTTGADLSAPNAKTVLPAVLPPSPGPGPINVTGPGTPEGDSSFIDLPMNGSPRGYFLLPALGLKKDEPAALLVVLHQDVSSGREISKDLGLDGLRRQGITLAYPNGYGGSWNAGACCGVAARQGIDDVGFVTAVLNDVGRHTSIDPERRALLGYSGGGMLAYRLLCRPHPDLVAAVEIGGSLESHCPNGTELPDLLSIHGAKDGSVGLTQARFVTHLGMAPRSVTSTLSLVAGQAGCAARTDREINGIDVWTFPTCRGGSTIQAQIVPEAGHGWADVGGAARASAFLVPKLAKR